MGRGGKRDFYNNTTSLAVGALKSLHVYLTEKQQAVPGKILVLNEKYRICKILGGIFEKQNHKNIESSYRRNLKKNKGKLYVIKIRQIVSNLRKM